MRPVVGNDWGLMMIIDIDVHALWSSGEVRLITTRVTGPLVSLYISVIAPYLATGVLIYLSHSTIPHHTLGTAVGFAGLLCTINAALWWGASAKISTFVIYYLYVCLQLSLLRQIFSSWSLMIWVSSIADVCSMPGISTDVALYING